MDQQQCDAGELDGLLGKVRANDASALRDVEALLDRFPGDSRLSFLRGSILAESGRYADAIRELDETLQLNPDYDVARFQLGLLLVTQRDRTKALEVWSALGARRRDDPFAMFAFGIQELLEGRVPQAVRSLEAGIALNADVPALSDDMRAIINRILAKPVGAAQLHVSDADREHLLISEYVLGSYRSH